MSLKLDAVTSALSDRFRVEREIGLGGWAVVYLARDLKHGRQVAIKVLRPDVASALGGQRFEREIDVVAGLRHPHILPLHDSGVIGELPYYVMPYVEGESLRDRLDREGPLSIEIAIRVASEVADALSYAHVRGVVHRDIKPANILMDSGHAVVTDFGIAGVTQSISAQQLTSTGISPGTPKYMSPEQITGETRVDPRSDIYSLGCVLYEMLAGDAPFSGTSQRAIIARKLVDPIPRLRVVRERVPSSLEQLTERALARLPADRFQTAAELGQALAGAPETAAPSPLSPPRVQRSPRAWLALICATGLVVAVGLSVIGLVTTVAFDQKIQMPRAFTPSRVDLPLVGLQALIPSVIYLLAALALYVAGKLLIGGLLPRLPGVGPLITRGRTQLTGALRDSSHRVRPTTVADAFFVFAVLGSVFAMSRFDDLLRVVWTTETAALACASRPLHRAYLWILTGLVTGLALAWVALFRWLGSRPRRAGRFRLSRWGSLAWIMGLLIVMTLPWRMLWDAQGERVRVSGERGYLMRETPAELVVYHPDRGATIRHDVGPGLDVERLGSTGYLFEEARVFESGEPECISVTGGISQRGEP